MVSAKIIIQPFPDVVEKKKGGNAPPFFKSLNNGDYPLAKLLS